MFYFYPIGRTIILSKTYRKSSMSLHIQGPSDLEGFIVLMKVVKRRNCGFEFSFQCSKKCLPFFTVGTELKKNVFCPNKINIQIDSIYSSKKCIL